MLKDFNILHLFAVIIICMTATGIVDIIMDAKLQIAQFDVRQVKKEEQNK